MRYETERNRKEYTKCDICGRQMKPWETTRVDGKPVCRKCFEENNEEDDGYEQDRVR